MNIQCDVNTIDLFEALELFEVGLANRQKVGSESSHSLLADLGDQENTNGAERIEQDAVNRVEYESVLAGIVCALVGAEWPRQIRFRDDDEENGRNHAVETRSLFDENQKYVS